jgi:peptidoglycan/xylan/chitin deacetylase (PgdA/CDA1 family)
VNRPAPTPSGLRIEYTAEEPGTLLSRIDLPEHARRVVLTYDDGPEPGGTDRVLEALAEQGASATFFVLMTRVRRHPSLLAEVVAAGHEIALHGIDHRSLPTLDPALVRRQVADGRRELQDATGRDVTWFRPPYGNQSPATWRAVVDAGMTPVLWSSVLLDWQELTVGEHVEAAARKREPGNILLAHDGFATAADGAHDGPAPRIDRGELNRRLLERYRRMNLTGCSLGEAVRIGSPVSRVWLRPVPTPDEDR